MRFRNVQFLALCIALVGLVMFSGGQRSGAVPAAQTSDPAVAELQTAVAELQAGATEQAGRISALEATVAALQASLSPTPAALATTVEVDMIDIAFEPTEITIPADTEVTIKLVNKGAAQHNFNIDALNVKSDTLNGGESGEIKITAAAGEYDYYCAIPGHKEAGMVGKIKVVAAEAAASGDSSMATAVDVSLVDIAFEPTTLQIAANTDVTINLNNKGAAQHNFTIDGTAFASSTIDAGGTEQLIVNLPPGEYTYFCNVPGHKEAGMVGKLTVV